MTLDPGKVKTDYNEMALAVGRFIMNFNVLDDRLNYVIGILVNPKDVARGEIVGASILSFDTKRKLTHALVRQLYGEETAEAYGPLNQKLRKINTVRNELAHGEQWYDLEGDLRQRHPRVTNKGYDPRHTEHSPKDIEQFTAETADLEADLWKFAKEHLGQDE